MYIGELIKKYRTEHELSQRAFASRTSLSPSYINTLEKIYNPKTNKPYSVTTDVAKELASAMNINIEELLNMLDKNQEFILKEESNSYSHNTKQAYPLLGMVKAGYNYLANENIIGYVNIDKHVSDPENYFALKVTGDSMQPIMYEDDIVIVHRQPDIESGQIGIILIDNEEATVKKVIKHENYVELVAFNPYYTPKKLDNKNKFSIIGKVTEARISKIFE